MNVEGKTAHLSELAADTLTPCIRSSQPTLDSAMGAADSCCKLTQPNSPHLKQHQLLGLLWSQGWLSCLHQEQARSEEEEREAIKQWKGWSSQIMPQYPVTWVDNSWRLSLQHPPSPPGPRDSQQKPWWWTLTLLFLLHCLFLLFLHSYF